MKKKFRSRVFLTFLISYILIMLLPIINNLINTYLYSVSMNDILADGQYKTLKQASSYLDHEFEQASHVYEYILSDKAIQEIIYNSSNFNSYDAYQIMTLLSNYFREGNFIREVLLFLPANNTLISSKNVITKNVVSLDIYGMNLNAVQDYNPGYYFFNIVPHSNLKLPGYSGNLTLLLRKVHITEIDEFNPIIVFMVSENQINSAMDSFLPSEENVWSIQNMDGSNLFLSSPETDTESGSNWEQYSVTSSYVPIKYNLFVGKNFLKNTWLELGSMIVISVAFTVVTIALAYGCSYRNYLPIHNILTRLNSLNPDLFLHLLPKKNSPNEYETIESFVADAAYQMEYSKPILTNIFLKRLLVSGTEIDVKECQTLYHLDFCSDLFYVALFSYQRSAAAEESVGFEKYASKLQIIVNKAFADFGNVYFVNIDDIHPVFILNIHPDSRGKLKNCFSQIQQMIEKDPQLYFTCGISNENLLPENIRIAYINAEAALDHCVNRNDFIYFDDISINPITYKCFTESVKPFIHILKSGNLSDAEDFLDKMIAKNMDTDNFTVSSLRYLYINIMNGIYSVYEELGFSAELVLSGKEAIKNMDAISTIQEFKNCILAYCKNICEKINNHMQTSNEMLIEKVQSYLRENYKNQELNVSFLAEWLHITPSYLSTIFKEGTGHNLSDYIHTIRIEQAVKMLEQPELTIATIAKECGYSSDLTLTRAFKKIMGVTPGVYRKQLK